MGKRFYTLNEHYFDSINNEEKAYWLGYLYADGNIINGNQRKYTVRLFADVRDIDILKKIKISFESNKPIHWNKPTTTGQMGCVEFCSKYLVSKCIEYYLVPCKTFLIKFPTFISEELIRHFIRGYFEGDGCILIAPPTINIVSTEEFCLKLKDIIKTKLHINCNIGRRHKNRDNNIRHIQFGGRHQVMRFLEFIYNDCSIFLDRKYKKYIEFKKLYNKLYGDDYVKNSACNINFT